LRPTEHQAGIAARLVEAKCPLLSHGIWQCLSELCEASAQSNDEALEDRYGSLAPRLADATSLLGRGDLHDL